MVVQPWGRCFHISTMTTEMDHQFIVSGIGLPFNVKPQLFPQREHVPVLI
jgi:hypothetical protein